jgi:hypothetical protein
MSTLELPNHCCPGCGTRLRASPRYPWYFCANCLALAEDGDGRRLLFGNSSISGGLEWRYADDPTSVESDCISVGCRILGREVYVTEARLGGVVAQPVNRATLASLLAEEGGRDLTRKSKS